MLFNDAMSVVQQQTTHNGEAHVEIKLQKEKKSELWEELRKL